MTETQLNMAKDDLALEAANLCIKFRANKNPPIAELLDLVAKLVPAAQRGIDIINYGTESALFKCNICQLLWIDPVTISCGHTFCRFCTERMHSCRVCGDLIFSYYRDSVSPNYLLIKICEKWFPEQVKFHNQICGARKFLKDGEHSKAIRSFSDAITQAPDDARLKLMRCDAYLADKDYETALRDADAVLATSRDVLGQFRRAEALAGLLRYNEAISFLLDCRILGNVTECIYERIFKILKDSLTALSLTISPKDKDSVVQLIKDTFPILVQLSNDQLTQSSKSDQSMFLGNSSREKVKSCSPVFDADISVDCSAESNVKKDAIVNLPRAESSCEKELENDNLLKKHVDNMMHKTEKETAKVTQSDEITSKISDKDTDAPDISADLLSIEEFECPLCFRLLYKPVTTLCGHTFCCDCLCRHLDYRRYCPLCNTFFVEYMAEIRLATTKAVERIIDVYFHKELEQRLKQNIREAPVFISEVELNNVPIFVCTYAYPSVQCMLHVFEPRYRLMVRRCVERASRQFGMCAPVDDEHEENFASYGTMLEILDVQYLPDGRSIVSTVGRRRFQVINRDVCDGYHVANVRLLQDDCVPMVMTDDVFARELYKEVHTWFFSLPWALRRTIVKKLGKFPDMPPVDMNRSRFTDAAHNMATDIDGPDFLWYAAAVLLPQSHEEQMRFIAMTSLKERMLLLRQMVTSAQSRGTTFALYLGQVAASLGLSVSTLVALIVVIFLALVTRLL